MLRRRSLERVSFLRNRNTLSFFIWRMFSPANRRPLRRNMRQREALVEHPTRVDEFVPSAAPPPRDVAAPALAPSPAPPPALNPLPPLPSLPATDVLFL